MSVRTVWRSARSALCCYPLSVLVFAALGILFADSAVSEIHGTAVFYASLAREIADSGDPLAVFSGERAYLLKPPLQLWLSAAAIKVLGPSGFAASFFSRLFGVGAVVLTVLLGRRLYGAAAGWYAGVVLLTTSTFLQFSATLRMESLLSCGILLALLGHLHGPHGARPSLYFSGVSLGVLAKGPAGLLPLVISPVHAALSVRRSGELRAWLRASSILLVPAAWYGLMLVLNGSAPLRDLAADTLRGGEPGVLEHLGSAVETYAITPARRYWPWLPLMFAGLYWALVDAFGKRVRPRRRARAGLLLAWVGVVVLVSAWKPDHDIRYLYPALPALALLSGWALSRLLGRRIAVWMLALVALAGLGAWTCVVKPSLLFTDTRPALAAMRGYVADNTQPDQLLPVLGTQITDLSGPRRQSEHRDWLHFYLGRQARLYSIRALEFERRRGKAYRRRQIRAEPFLFIGKMPRREAIARDLGFQTLAATPAMLLGLRRGREP